MYTIQKRQSNLGLWHTHMYENNERSAIIRADQLKDRLPDIQVRVLNENGILIYQA